MTHVHYDYSLVLVSAIVALLACYFAVSVEQTLFRGSRPKYEWLILICGGALLGAAIWCMHFVAIMASQMPGMQSFHLGLSLVSYLIAFAASVFAIWLTTRFTLPLFRLTLGAVLMGLGISGMHYTGMLALNIQGYEVRYEPVLAICSILIAIGGSWIAFLLAFRNKHARHFRMALKFAIAFTLTMTIVVMHYTGIGAMSLFP